MTENPQRIDLGDERQSGRPVRCRAVTLEAALRSRFLKLGFLAPCPFYPFLMG